MNKHIVLGVTGSIAAYKSIEFVRLLRALGAEVRVVMTEAAHAFVTELTLQAISGHPVASRHLDGDTEGSMGHIALARWADFIVIAPATAHTLAKLAHGLCDNLLMDICLATGGVSGDTSGDVFGTPLMLAPAMNCQMWAHPATRDNVRLLRARGARFCGPDAGSQACGETGMGRMAAPDAIISALRDHFSAVAVLTGQRVLVTAGPTLEPIDPVRYIGNRSSGKMGYAIARAARAAGAEVTLISGPVHQDVPAAVLCLRVDTAAEMLVAVLDRVADCDIFIGAAAVADYRPGRMADHKIKKRDPTLTLNLTRTEDILSRVAGHESAPFTVGFAAETQHLQSNAQGKLRRKRLDMIAANPVGLQGQGLDSDDNALELYWPGGGQSLPLASKASLAVALIDIIAERYHEKHTT